MLGPISGDLTVDTFASKLRSMSSKCFWKSQFMVKHFFQFLSSCFSSIVLGVMSCLMHFWKLLISSFYSSTNLCCYSHEQFSLCPQIRCLHAQQTLIFCEIVVERDELIISLLLTQISPSRLMEDTLSFRIKNMHCALRPPVLLAICILSNPSLYLPVF